jgi:hypothetical protein
VSKSCTAGGRSKNDTCEIPQLLPLGHCRRQVEVILKRTTVPLEFLQARQRRCECREDVRILPLHVEPALKPLQQRETKQRQTVGIETEMEVTCAAELQRL